MNEPTIRRAEPRDAAVLAELGRQTFVESHGQSASKEILDRYLNVKYDPQVVLDELNDPNNLIHLITFGEQAVGYAKLVLNMSHPNVAEPKAAKLDRLYVLEAYHDQKLGLALFNHQLELAKALDQQAMWLFVWVDNHRAIRFYTKAGFEIVGSHLFALSSTHTNLNHVMNLHW
jgi:ribosomal protein S18 acetylase RimI-like enzyme